MKRIIILGMVIYSLLGFGLLSIPFNNVNISEGSMLVEYGLPHPWLIVHRVLAGDKSQPASMGWWKTDELSFNFSGFLLDVAIAVLAGVVLTMATVRVCHWMSVRRHNQRAENQ